MPRLARLFCSCCLPFAAAVLWFWPTLDVGFLADDFNLAYYLDCESGRPRWDRVLAEFAGPWFGVRDLYRPMVSVSIALNLATGGMAAPGFHAVNVLLVAIGAAATGWCAAVLLPGALRLPAAVAGGAYVLHPAAVEPASWIAARTSGMEVAFVALALALYARFLRHPAADRRTGRPPFGALGCALLALLSKEGAIVLPVGFAAIDVLLAGPGFRARLLRLLPICALTACYLCWRRLVLGTFTSFDEHVSTAAMLHGLPGSLAGFFLPPGVPQAVVLPALAVCLAAAARAGLLRLAVLAAACGAALVPTSTAPPANADAAAFSGRFLFAGLPMLGCLLASACAGNGPWRWLGAAASLFVLGGYGLAARELTAGYVRGGGDVAEMRSQLVAAAAAQSDGKPLAIVSVLPGKQPLLVHLGLAGLVLQRPFADRNFPVVGLTNVLEPDPAAASLYRDASPLRAVLDAGGVLARWGGRDQGLALDRAAPAAPRDLLQDGEQPRRFRFVQPVRGSSIAVLRVRLPVAVQECRLALLGEGPAIPFGEQVRTVPAPAAEFWFDVTSSVALLLADVTGVSLQGFTVETGGAAPPRGTMVEALAAPALLPLLEPLAGRELRLDGLHRAVRPPRRDVPLRFVLLLPTQSVATTVAAGGAIAADDPIIRPARFAVDVLGRVPAHCYWQTVPDHPGEPQRTPLDWFELR